ncbi:MAG: LysR family transcriptional regulator [Paracoccus sp. (in: a-proteobacteria)]|nr:LysR family transcriptional regulator [Paracoccus sp. (in: a-proteobacteria)]
MNEARILSNLPVFRAVATLGSFSAAAGQMGVTPSAVSQSIRALEELLGVQLISRTSRSMHLTDAGARLLASIGEPLAQLSAAMQAAQGHADQPEERLHLIAPAPACALLIRPYLADFLDAHPRLRLEISSGDCPADLAKAGIDAVISPQGSGAVASVGTDSIALPFGPPLRRALLASRDYLARHGKPGDPDDLATHRLCRYRAQGSPRPEPLIIRRGTTLIEIAPPAAFITEDQTLIETLLHAGQAIAPVWLHPGQPPPETRDLVEILPEFAPPALQFHLYAPAGRGLHRALHALAARAAPPPESATGSPPSVTDAIFDQFGALKRHEVIV